MKARAFRQVTIVLIAMLFVTVLSSCGEKAVNIVVQTPIPVALVATPGPTTCPTSAPAMCPTPAATVCPTLAPTDCPTPVVGSLQAAFPVVAPEELIVLYIDDISALVPISYTWNVLSQGEIIAGQGTSSIQYRAPITPGTYGITVKISACSYYQEMSLPIIVANGVTITPPSPPPPEPTPTLPCSTALKADLFPYGSGCPSEGSWGSAEYCQPAPGRFIANVELHSLRPNTNYDLSFQAIEGSSRTDDLLLQSCEEKTSRGDAYCDITLPATNEQGDIWAQVSRYLIPGEYDLKLLLKDASTSDYCVAMFNDGPIPLKLEPPPPFQNGMSYVTWQSGAFSTERADESLKALAETGANWLALIVTGYQDKASSTTIQYDLPKTPTDQDLIHVIDQAKKLGLSVMLKPHVDLLNDPEHWRGQIGQGFSESQWQSWFTSYQGFIFHYASLAEEQGVKILSVGTELVTASSREADWQKVLEGVRARFGGELVYASNWDEPSRDWWAKLNYIGVDAYFPLLTDSDTPTVEDLQTAWSSHVAILKNLHEKTRLNVILTEIGYRSIQGAHNNPAQWQQDAVVDLEEQAKLYEAALKTFCGQEWVSGIYWWNWLTDPDQGGPNDTDYTPHGKPAESVLKKYNPTCGEIHCVSYPLVSYNKTNSCPISGASGQVCYVSSFDGPFQATVRLEGVKPNHTYVLSVNCKENTAACKLLAEGGENCREYNGEGYCDISLAPPTDETGKLERTIEKPLPSGEYVVKLFIKDPASNFCIPLYNDKPGSFTIK